MEFQACDLEAANTALASVIDGPGGAAELIAAARRLLPFTAAFCVVNRKHQRPLYLADSYPDGAAKDAVQLYAGSTYLLNPVYNAILDGLPPGPIGNPGRAAMEAVANPSRTQDLYFVADGTGGHVFSETYEQHQENVRKWRQVERDRRQAEQDQQAQPPTSN